MIRLREEMQTEKPTMLNCSKDAHIIFDVFSLNIWVRHCEELIREDWKKLMGLIPSISYKARPPGSTMQFVQVNKGRSALLLVDPGSDYKA
jgi:hypothetical protein